LTQLVINTNTVLHMPSYIYSVKYKSYREDVSNVTDFE